MKTSHRELLSLDRAKTKAVNHLSHALKTPVSTFSGTLTILSKKLCKLPDEAWKRPMGRALRSIKRIKRLQDEIRDIILEKESETENVLARFLEQCADLLENTIENESEDSLLLDRVRSRINKLFSVKKSEPEDVLLDDFVAHRFERLKPNFRHRDLKIDLLLGPVPSITIP